MRVSSQAKHDGAAPSVLMAEESQLLQCWPPYFLEGSFLINTPGKSPFLRIDSKRVSSSARQLQQRPGRSLLASLRMRLELTLRNGTLSPYAGAAQTIDPFTGGSRQRTATWTGFLAQHHVSPPQEGIGQTSGTICAPNIWHVSRCTRSAPPRSPKQAFCWWSKHRQSVVSSQRTMSRSRGSDGTSYVLVRVVIELWTAKPLSYPTV